MKIQIKNMSLIVKVFILFSLTILPITVIGIVSLWVVNTRSEMELLQSVSINMGNFSSEFEDQLRQAYQLSGDILSYRAATKLSNPKFPMDMYERVTNANLVRGLLSNIKRSNMSIANVRIYIPSLNKKYNAEGYPRGSQQDMSADDYALLDRLQGSINRLHQDHDRLFMLRFPSLEYPDLVSEIEFNKDILAKRLHASLLYEGSGYILTLREEILLYSLPNNMLALQALDMDYAEKGTYIGALSGSDWDYHVFRSPMPYIDGVYYQLIPKGQLFRPARISVSFTAALLVIIILCVSMFFLGAYRLIHTPLHGLILAFDKIKNMDFKARVTTPETSDFAYLYNGFNNMAERLDELIQQDYNLKLLLQKAELKQLQAQINPHFLYNSFFILNQMIYRGMHETSVKFSRLLGVYFQYITRNHYDIVLLKDEYKHACIYAEIQSIRFSDRVQVVFDDLPEEYGNISVPKLILQPILENAFIYGIEERMAGGYVYLKINHKADGLDILIEDNGEALTDEKLAKINKSIQSTEGEEVTGLLNISRRLQIYFKQSGALKVSRSVLGGMAVLIHIWTEVKPDESSAYR